MIEFDFTNEIILENEVVKLIPLGPEHISVLTHFSLNEPNLWEYSLLPASGLDNLKRYFTIALEERTAERSYPFIIFDKRTNTYAGSTRFCDIQMSHQTAQIGYTWLGQDFHGTGLNKNCKFLLLQYAFEVLNLARLEFRADYNNKKSIAAMKSIGCVEEGILRSNCRGLIGRRDSIVLSILKQEWFGTAKDNLMFKIRSTKSI